MDERSAIVELFERMHEHGESLNELRAYVLALSVLCQHLVARTEAFPEAVLLLEKLRAASLFTDLDDDAREAVEQCFRRF